MLDTIEKRLGYQLPDGNQDPWVKVERIKPGLAINNYAGQSGVYIRCEKCGRHFPVENSPCTYCG